MNEGEELDGDAFEIIDHTIASPWERFIARIEESLRNWVTQGVIGAVKENDESEPLVLEETISHAGRSYTLTYVHGVNKEFEDPKYAHLPQRLSIFMDTSNDFSLHGHDVQRWFGVEDFIALWPLADSATDMHEASLLLSTLTTAADSTQCYVPLFVPIGERYEGRYMGYMIEDGYCVRFLCENYQSGTKQGQFGNMENLVEYFHKQLNANNNKGQYRDLTPFTTVSTRFTYTREDWFDEWRGIHICEICEEEKQRLAQESPKANIHLSTSFRANGDIYWGPLSDPLSALQLAAVWQHDSMPKNRFWADNKIRSDFKPKSAPVWNLQAAFRDFEKACPLTLSLRVLLTAYVESLEAPSLHLFLKPEDNVSEQQLKEQKQGLVQVMETLTKTITSLNSPVVPTQQELEGITRDLFSKADGDDAVASSMALHQVRALNLKPAPPFTLAGDLACRMLDMQCLSAIALLWIEFVKEVRWCWDHCIPLPRVPLDSQIDTSACLIYQKLQMMNYCINKKTKERKKKKPKAKADETKDTQSETKPPTTTTTNNKKKSNLDGWEDFDDEPAPGATKNTRRKSEEDFFRILNEPSESSKTTTTSTTTNTSEKDDEQMEEASANPDGWDDGNELEGLSSDSELGDSDDFHDAKSDENDKKILSLDGWDDLPDLDLSTQYLLYRESPIVAPETQDCGIMTEDMLKEQMEVFKSLGTSEEAALIRAKLQTPSLKSDMESFKAANEGCVLEDFVRWYSPRDWVTVESDGFDQNVIKESDKENGGEIRGKGMGREGHLSSRMRLPGNLWRQMWKEAEAIPANKQVPLFKHIAEAEKVIHYFENLSLPDLVQQIISIVLNVILYTFKPSSLKTSEEEEQETDKRKIPHTHTTQPQGVDLPPFVQTFDHFIRAIDSYWHESYSTESPIQVENLTTLWQEFQQLECMAAKATSLLQKMPGKLNIVSHLLADEEVTIPQQLRPDFSPIFFPDNGDSVSADTREYVIRCPGHKTEPVPNRLYACLSTHEAKVATVFALDE